MKKIFIALFTLFTINQLKAQNITDSWIGSIRVGGTQLHVIFNIKRLTDTTYVSTFDSPDQKVFGIACSTTTVKKDSLFIGIAVIGGSYDGIWNGRDSISGTYKQGGGKVYLGLRRVTDAEKNRLSTDPVRPQTPKPPYGYFNERVEYDNADQSLHYGATFTRPDVKGKYPTVIIISGSGTQDRDGSMFGGHKPYWVLADYLTQNGIAVLRVDDRGAGRSSMGDNISSKTTLDFSYDVEASLNYLRTRPDVNRKRIGLIGHSEGGIIAPMVAARRSDVDFIVLWGAPEIGGAQVLTEQYAYALKQQGVDTAAVNAFKALHLQILNLFASSPNVDSLDQKITPVFDEWKKAQTQKTLDALNIHDDAIKNMYKTYNSMYNVAWLRFFITYNPELDLRKVKCSVLAVNGEKDTQVGFEENLTKIDDVLTKSGNRNFKIIPLPNLNHLLQTAQTGDVSEYEKINETISPIALNIICNWIKLQVR